MSQEKRDKFILAGALAFCAVAVVAWVTDPDKEVIGPIFDPANNGR